nr:hypothetical protein [uncultured Selenomonas sp.]
MTEKELLTIFDSVPAEMLQEGLESRMQAALDEMTEKYSDDDFAVSLAARILRVTMDYNKEFMFRVLCKILVTR